MKNPDLRAKAERILSRINKSTIYSDQLITVKRQLEDQYINGYLYALNKLLSELNDPDAEISNLRELKIRIVEMINE